MMNNIRSKKMFISHVDSFGGAENVLINIIKLYNSEDVIVITNKRGNGKFSEKINKEYNVKRFTFGLLSNSIVKSLLEFSLTMISLIRLINIVKKYNIDVIYSNTSVNLIGILAALLTRKKHVWHVHEQFGGVFNSKFKVLYKKLMNYENNENIYISNAIKNEWEKNIGKVRSKVLRNPITIKVQPNNKSIGNKVVLGFAGSIVENKNLILLLQSLNYLTEKNNNFQLLVAGDGNLKDQMVNYCTENNLNDNIEFLGNIDCMENFYNAIDVLVLPSFTEGVPLVVLEAAGRGKMIIMTENSGINEILDDNTDYLSINPYDKNDLIKVLNSVLENHNIIKEYSTNSFKKINKYIKENNFEKELKNIL
ncbi:TPA: glycosyltransferase family 4 protein [Clostridium perfringens]|nr:glycosyltransferase family 4 protein [Clostridium perfringens]